MVKRLYRQGDVLLIETTDSRDTEPAPKDPRGLVLAEGESSGHHHQVFGRGAKLFRFKASAALAERLLVVGEAGAELRVVGGGGGGVDRHTPIHLGPGKFLVRTQRAWTAADEQRHRAVAD
jgi:hypothetical protein